MASSVSKDETLRILASLGIRYPSDTKFTMEVLIEKLTKAIDIAQQVQTNVPESFDPSGFTKWKRGDEDSTKALLAYRQLSMEESGAAKLRKMVTGDGAPSLYIDVFSDIRQTLMGIVHNYSGPVKSKLFLVEDKEKTYNITFRVRIFWIPFAYLASQLIIHRS